MRLEQHSNPADVPPQRIPLEGGVLRLWPQWLAAAQADPLLTELCQVLPLQQHDIRIYGRQVAQPRLSAWIGDPGAHYQYSGQRFEPHPWPASLQALRLQLQAHTGHVFNSVLANLYRNGNDSMGWHSDDEPELGPEPIIASLSLGASRDIRFRHRRRRDLAPLTLALAHGSLLCMEGGTQSHWQHSLPRRRRVSTPRLNLTFRYIRPPARPTT